MSAEPTKADRPAAASQEMHLEAIYDRRLSSDIDFRREMWLILCSGFFQRFVPRTSTVLEIGAGFCEFINNIEAAKKIAVDLNPALERYADSDVQISLTSTTDLKEIADNSIDVVFASNFFEHLSRPEIVLTMREARRVLKRGGRFLILQPNIRFCARDYWMFFDHVTPLDDRSMTEALEINGFRVVKTVVRFLPYTTKSRLPKSPLLIRLYLKFPLLWTIFGQQSFFVALADKP